MKRNFRGPIFLLLFSVSDGKNFAHKILSHGWRHGQPIAYTNLFWPRWRLQWQAVSWTHSVLGLSVTRMFLINRSILYALICKPWPKLAYNRFTMTGSGHGFPNIKPQILCLQSVKIWSEKISVCGVLAILKSCAQTVKCKGEKVTRKKVRSENKRVWGSYKRMRRCPIIRGVKTKSNSYRRVFVLITHHTSKCYATSIICHLTYALYCNTKHLHTLYMLRAEWTESLSKYKSEWETITFILAVIFNGLPTQNGYQSAPSANTC